MGRDYAAGDSKYIFKNYHNFGWKIISIGIDKQ